MLPEVIEFLNTSDGQSAIAESFGNFWDENQIANRYTYDSNNNIIDLRHASKAFNITSAQCDLGVDPTQAAYNTQLLGVLFEIRQGASRFPGERASSFSPGDLRSNEIGAEAARSGLSLQEYLRRLVRNGR